MLDFRYHALSLVAVFLALAIGIVLGVTIGDSLVSGAERSLRSNLRADVETARSDAAQARDSVGARDRMLDQLYPQLVATRLTGERIAVVSWGPLPDNVQSGVRDAVSKAGGRLDSVSIIKTPLSDLQQAVGPGEWATDTIDGTALKNLGSSLARSIAGGGQLAAALHGQLPDSYAGRYRRADAVVFYEAPKPDNPSSEDQGARERDDDRAKTIEGAMIDEMRKRLIAVVGVEASSANPSQIPRYKSLQISSSDSVDKSGGRLALVFALAGAKGSFGFKSTVDSPLPSGQLVP